MQEYGFDFYTDNVCVALNVIQMICKCNYIIMENVAYTQCVRIEYSKFSLKSIYINAVLIYMLAHSL